jgi:hypothetical protein
MFSDKYRQHWGFSGWQLLTLFSVPLFQKPQILEERGRFAHLQDKKKALII